MHHWPWRAMIIGAVATVLIYTATRPDPDTSGLSEASTDQLIEQLRSSRNVVQRAAASRLINQGAEAIPQLVAAVEQAPEGQLWQIFLVLEDMYVSADQSVSDAAEDAVEQLSVSHRSDVRKAADDLFNANQSRRQLRAFAKFESFSGRLVASAAGRSGSELSLPDLVVIDAGWTGGEDGLKYVRRMKNLRAVHIGNQAPLSEDAIQGLKTVAQSFRRESEGCLGVELTPDRRSGDLVINWVVLRSPAERAGLRVGDQIMKLDNQPFEDYLDYIRCLCSRPPGDDLPLEIARDGIAIAVTATLGTDFGTGRCRCQGTAAEPALPTTFDDVPRPRGRRLSPPTTDHFISPSTHEHGHHREFPPFQAPGRPR